MITKQIETLETGTRQQIFATVTIEDWKRPCSEWDKNLDNTIKALRQIDPQVNQNGSNASAEVWAVNVLLNPNTLRILDESPVLFQTAWHFGALV